MAPIAADALVIGSGPNGLVAANLLADAGWDVLVLEAQPDPGGAVRSGESAELGFRHDLFSSFYPLAAGSPVVRGLALEDHGLRWRRAGVVVAHPLRDGRCAALCREVEETAASLERFAPGDGAAWRRVARLWDSIGDALMQGLTSPFPPLRAGVRLAGRLRARGLLRFARFGVLPTRRFGDEAFAGEGGPLLLAGSALHGDLDPGAAGGTMFGWVLCGLGQQLGFPVPEGGAGGLSGALLARLRAAGGEVRCDAAVEAIAVRGGRGPRGGAGRGAGEGAPPPGGAPRGGGGGPAACRGGEGGPAPPRGAAGHGPRPRRAVPGHGPVRELRRDAPAAGVRDGVGLHPRAAPRRRRCGAGRA